MSETKLSIIEVLCVYSKVILTVFDNISMVILKWMFER